MKISVFLLILCVVAQISGTYLHAEEIPVDKLMYTGISDEGLQKEATSLDIPADCTVRYVTGMRSLNKAYQAGNLSWTGYITAKRNFIEDID